MVAKFYKLTAEIPLNIMGLSRIENQLPKMSLRPEQDAFVNDFADTLTRRGLGDLALLVLQVGQPLSFIGGQLLWMAQPALSIVLPKQQVAQVAHLLEEPSAVQSLIARLEADEA